MARILKKYITFADVGTSVEVGGTVPGDFVTSGLVFIETPFDGTTTLNVGFVSNNQGGAAAVAALASALVTTVAGNVAFDELSTATNKRCTVADTIKVAIAGTSPTVGKAIVYLTVENLNPILNR